MISSAANNLFGKIIVDKDLYALSALRENPLLLSLEESLVLKFIADFFDANKKNLPSLELVKTVLPSITEKPTEVSEFYLNTLRNNYANSYIQSSLQIIHSKLNGTVEGLNSAKEEFYNRALALRSQASTVQTYNFTSLTKSLINDYKATKYCTNTSRTVLGFPKIDSFSRGISGGDFVSIVGRPGTGKTILMVHSAMHASKPILGEGPEYKKILFVSMEMPALEIAQRMSAMMFNLDMTHLQSGQFSSEEEEHFIMSMRKLHSMKERIVIVEGGVTSTIDDIEEKISIEKPDVVYIDAAYLIKSSKRIKTDPKNKVNDIAEFLKTDVAMACNIPVICSYQFNRSVIGKDKKIRGTLDGISWSDAVGQLSSISLGIMDDSDTESDDMEIGLYNRALKKINIMKGRRGESGSFLINWDFKRSDFSQIESIDKLEVFE